MQFVASLLATLIKEGPARFGHGERGRFYTTTAMLNCNVHRSGDSEGCWRPALPSRIKSWHDVPGIGPCPWIRRRWQEGEWRARGSNRRLYRQPSAWQQCSRRTKAYWWCNPAAENHGSGKKSVQDAGSIPGPCQHPQARCRLVPVHWGHCWSLFFMYFPLPCCLCIRNPR